MKSDRHFRRRLLLLSNPEAAHLRDLAIRRRKELRPGDEQIASQARPDSQSPLRLLPGGATTFHTANDAEKECRTPRK